tara:strand:+ start:4217 stop:5920 length:1704 start_codon:yes stop_codon:yes gene_type:complete
VSYLVIIFLFRNSLFVKWNNSDLKKHQIRGIINQLIQNEQGKVVIEARALNDLKLELWKFLRLAGNRRIMTTVLQELNNELENDAKPIIHRICKEFELNIEIFEKFKSLVNNSISSTTIPDFKNMENKKSKSPKSHMEDLSCETPMDGSLSGDGITDHNNIGKELNIDFIPLVKQVDAETDDISREVQEALLVGHDMDFLMEFLDLEDFEINPYEGISREFENEKKSSPHLKEEASFLNIDFLPLILEVEEEQEAMNPILDFHEIEVDYEVVIDPFIKKQISDMLKSHVKEQLEEDTVILDNDVLDLGRMQLPAVKFYSDRESKRVKLLHAIAELGDIREVPILSEMMDVEENESISNLIKEIIFKFLSEYPDDEDDLETNTDNLEFGNYYVFNRLFNALDMESQLILLEEIVQIGEQHELDFLETLHNHPIRMIREKARSVSAILKNKLKDIKNNQKADPTISDNDHSTDSVEAAKHTTTEDMETSKTPSSIKAGLTKVSHNDKVCTKRDSMEFNDLFQIDFDMAPSEKLINQEGTVNRGDVNFQELEEIHFLEQLKDLTNKIFNR